MQIAPTGPAALVSCPQVEYTRKIVFARGGDCFPGTQLPTVVRPQMDYGVQPRRRRVRSNRELAHARLYV